MEKLWRALRLSVGRAVLTLIDDASKLQSAQLEALPGEVLDGVERVQNYGYTSHPHLGAEAVFVALGGQRQHPVILAVDDRRHRVTDLEAGEVCIYTDEDGNSGDHRIILKRGKKIEIRCGASSIVMTETSIQLTSARIDLN